ncbi:tRNA(Ile)-lysidine synthetase [Candidatus Hodgkinia cicadicola]|uniref:tRNA(Ile)-lysidine synthetase n=1 Tax=Candidatus Hodgkinia cicadicola TaxID=573658 RepID=A0ABX4MI80_9HYPH|nr:tRNA(Ile)-lysidine synthetase [Candidatus Hodgkinia cicadicola]
MKLRSIQAKESIIENNIGLIRMLGVSGGKDSSIELFKTKLKWQYGVNIKVNHNTRYEISLECCLISRCNWLKRVLTDVFDPNSQTKLSNQRRLLLIWTSKKLGTYIIKTAHTYNDNIDLIGGRLQQGLVNYTMSILNKIKFLIFKITKVNTIILLDLEQRCLICHNDLSNKNAWYAKSNWQQIQNKISMFSSLLCLNSSNRNKPNS